MGTLQRLPAIVGQGTYCTTAETAFTLPLSSSRPTCESFSTLYSIVQHRLKRTMLLSAAKPSEQLCMKKFCAYSVALLSTSRHGRICTACTASPGVASELALTARVIGGEEARQVGLVTQCFEDEAALQQHAHKTAELIAAKSPLAIVGTKRVLIHAR